MNLGRFVTLEGGEGVGKSTLASNLQKKLLELDIKCLLTREPGGSLGGEAIRNIVLNPPHHQDWSPLTQTLLFFAARCDHLENVIKPALLRGEWVICDRFTDSTRAYQAVAGGVDDHVVSTLDQLVVNEQQPDLTLLLDMPLEVSAKRRIERNGPQDAFEKLPQSFHENVRQAFLEIADRYKDRCYVLDASNSVDQVTAEALELICKRFSVQ
ncbi:dTMP kinase [Hirschia baltica]|uniref:Thymidylate kinase n=1 Tax=Hirschia baltica (strain ATCC 49814 / DSM 5838 / IFAM 1418) TaxID=582402 RepID=C6XJM4_HIRBI|nr:dTMP kinase [Hirschia baltica]ACT59319.1 thymidylate kinase [Hirschia baltica ATCC 49814]